MCCLCELRARRWVLTLHCVLSVCAKGMEMGSDSEFVDVEGESFEDYQPRAGRKRRISQVKRPAFFIWTVTVAVAVVVFLRCTLWRSPGRITSVHSLFHNERIVCYSFFITLPHGQSLIIFRRILLHFWREKCF